MYTTKIGKDMILILKPWGVGAEPIFKNHPERLDDISNYIKKRVVKGNDLVCVDKVIGEFVDFNYDDSYKVSISFTMIFHSYCPVMHLDVLGYKTDLAGSIFLADGCTVIATFLPNGGILDD